MHAENLVGALIGQHFGEAFGFVIDLCPAVGGEGKLADLVGASFGLELLFGLADAGQFGLGVDHVELITCWYPSDAGLTPKAWGWKTSASPRTSAACSPTRVIAPKPLTFGHFGQGFSQATG